MTIGVWKNQGQVLVNGSLLPGQPTVIHEAGAQILSGTVFKMWYGTTNGVQYAESTDGKSWSTYSGNPIAGSGVRQFPRVYKHGTTYYLYSGGISGAMACYTSTDGVNFSVANANCLVVSQSWEHNGCFQLSVCTVDGNGKWWGYYSSVTAADQYLSGLATSTDGIHWTKDPGNPITAPYQPSNFGFQEVNGIFYGWTQMVQPGIPVFGGGAGTLGLPSDISRYWATSPGGPWNALPNGTPTYFRTTAAEGVGQPDGQVADPCIVSVNGDLYMFYSSVVTGETGGGQAISLAIAPSTTLAELVAGYEGVQNVPTPWGKGAGTGAPINLTATASDNFTRANANPAGGNWSLISAGNEGPGQILSDQFKPASITIGSGSWWNAETWPADQWAQSTVGTAATSGAYVGVATRTSVSGAYTEYRFYWNGTAGGSTGTFQVDRIVVGTYHAFFVSGFPGVVNLTDTLTMSAIGTTLSVYQNGNLLNVISDASIASGAAGVMSYASDAVVNSGISAWTGGGIIGAGPAPGPPVVYSVPDCRDYYIFPNLPVNVNGTLTYTVPSVDSRKAGAPIDSRASVPVASGTYPQNSRTPGTFGPGE